MAPCTAWSTFALSNTINGALPPSSRDTRFTVEADCSSKICNYNDVNMTKNFQMRNHNHINNFKIPILTLPTTVDPVNDIAATRGLLQSALPTIAAFCLEHVTTFNTPGGNPAFSAN